LKTWPSSNRKPRQNEASRYCEKILFADFSGLELNFSPSKNFSIFFYNNLTRNQKSENCGAVG